jgi:hypothetical protein
MNRPQSSQHRISVERHDVLVALVAAVCGGLGGWAVPELFAHVSDVKLWLFFATIVLALTTCLVTLGFFHGFQRVSEQRYDDLLRVANAIADTATHQAQLIPREKIYPEMADCIRNAQFQVAVITFLMYDWIKGQRTFLPPGCQRSAKFPTLVFN